LQLFFSLALIQILYDRENKQYGQKRRRKKDRIEVDKTMMYDEQATKMVTHSNRPFLGPLTDCLAKLLACQV
jgi:hypothetical protein